MIKKFFLQIVIISVIVCFFGLNFDSRVTIKFWFNDRFTLTDVSLFISLAVAYLLGIITTIPFYISKHFKKKKDKNTKVDE